MELLLNGRLQLNESCGNTRLCKINDSSDLAENEAQYVTHRNGIDNPKEGAE